MDNILLSCSTNFVSMYEILSLRGEQYFVILWHDVYEYVQNIVSTRWTKCCYPVARTLWVCTKHCLYKGNIILLSCSTTFVIMYKTLSLQCEQYIVILQHDICEYVQNIVFTRWTIYCYPVARPLWLCTKHCLYKHNNILLFCTTTFVGMYKTLSLQGEQYFVIL